MGIDLSLLPIANVDPCFSHEILVLERRSDLWPEIEKLPSNGLDISLSCYFASNEQGETAYGEIETDPYGDEIRTVTAGDLVTLRDTQEVRDNWRNRAVWAFLSELPPESRIALYWH